MKKNDWLVVADASVARIFNYENSHSMIEISTLTHPASRLKNSDLVSDRLGREFQSMGGGSRSAMDPKTFPKDHEFEIFAKEITQFLLQAHNQRQFDGLYIIAGPEFLGLLRAELSPELKKILIGELNKTLTELSPKEILEHLLVGSK